MVPVNSGEYRPVADPDVMPRSLVLTLIAGSLVGALFWAMLMALVIS